MINKLLNSIIIVFIIIIIFLISCKSEYFKGYKEAEKKKDNIYTSGATMRVLAQEFSSPSQGVRSTIPNAYIDISKL